MNSPMLAATIRNNKDIQNFPFLVTPKIDGVRALIVKGVLVSRSLKPIPNKRIKNILEHLLPEGADGEIFCGDLYTTTSIVMSCNAEGSFRFFWFDWAYDVNAPYSKRALSIRGYMLVHLADSQYVIPLIPCIINNLDELFDYEKAVLNNGLEGLILRKPDGIYKSGRSTLKEGLIMKLKRFIDSEATIIGTKELIHGTGDRSNILGSIVAKRHDGTVFKIGTGYTLHQRFTLWERREQIIGKIVKYKHMFQGEKEKPRGPVFVEIRHVDDM